MDFIRVFNLYDPLFFAASDGTAAPGLAVSAVSNATANVWTLHLRKGVVWHNGKDFSADDVVYTIQHSWGNPKNIFNAALKTIVDFANVRKLDSYTVQVPLKLGVAQFPTVTAFANCYVVQDGTTNFFNGNGTGPFKLKSFQPGSMSVFSANKNYWQQGHPYVDSLVVNSSFPTDQTRMNALLANDVDIVPGVPQALAVANDRGGRIVLGNRPGPQFNATSCRVDQPPFSDPRVRLAMKLIPDRAQYVSNIYYGYAAVCNDCPGYTDKYWASDLKRVQDLDKAKYLLKAAGLENFKFTLDTAPTVPGQSELATLFQQQALGAGVNVNVRVFPPSTYYTPANGFFVRKFSVDNFNVGVNSLSVFYMTSLLPSGPYNDSHWGGDGSANKLLYDALAETNVAKATDKWHAVQEIQFNAGPYVIPATVNWLDAYSPKVRGVQTTTALSCGNYNFTNGWLA